MPPASDYRPVPALAHTPEPHNMKANRPETDTLLMFGGFTDASAKA